MGGGIEEGIETIIPRCAEDGSPPPVSGSSNKGDTSPLQLPEDPMDEYEVSSPGRMRPRGVLFGCLGLGLAAAIGAVVGRSFNNVPQVSTVTSQNKAHAQNTQPGTGSGKNNYRSVRSDYVSNDEAGPWSETELWHSKSAKAGVSC